MGLKVIVYGVKGDRLWGKGDRLWGKGDRLWGKGKGDRLWGKGKGDRLWGKGKGDRLWGKGDRLRDEGKNAVRTLLYQHLEKTKIGFFSLKVIVYGGKSDICIDTR